MHILIVEDDAAICQELKQLLENALYQVTALDAFGDAAGDILKADPDIAHQLRQPGYGRPYRRGSRGDKSHRGCGRMRGQGS